MTTATTHTTLTALAADGRGFGRVLATRSSQPDTDAAAASGLPLEAVRAFAFDLELV